LLFFEAVANDLCIKKCLMKYLIKICDKQKQRQQASLFAAENYAISKKLRHVRVSFYCYKENVEKKKKKKK